MRIKIQSVSDIITNSSSEVFVIHGATLDKLTKELQALADLEGVTLEELFYEPTIGISWSIREEYEARGWEVSDNNAIILYEASDNSVPSWIEEYLNTKYDMECFQR